MTVFSDYSIAQCNSLQTVFTEEQLERYARSTSFDGKYRWCNEFTRKEQVSRTEVITIYIYIYIYILIYTHFTSWFQILTALLNHLFFLYEVPLSALPNKRFRYYRRNCSNVRAGGPSWTLDQQNSVKICENLENVRPGLWIFLHPNTMC